MIVSSFMALSLNRMLFAGMAMVGFALLVLSATENWFSVPVAASFSEVVSQPAPAAADLTVAVSDVAPTCTRWFKAFVLIAAFSVATSWLWKRQWTLVSSVFAAAALLISLAYPYAVMIRSPEISADATWLQMQHNNLTWLGGDIYMNAEFAAKGWRTKTYLIDAPRQMNVSELPSWSVTEFGLHRCEELLSWLGLTNVFCQFARRGWIFSVLGSLFLLAASFQKSKLSLNSNDNEGFHVGFISFPRASVALLLFGIAAGIASLFAWSLPFRANHVLAVAEQKCSEHDYLGAKTSLIRAAELLPTLRCETAFVAQLGILDRRLKLDTDYSKLVSVQQLERIGRYDQAYQGFEALLESQHHAIRGEALRGILRFAIQDYNSARFELSAERFLKVLKRSPGDVKLIYMMQLQGIREARPNDVNRLCGQMYAASERFNFGTRKILRAVSQQHAATAAGFGDDAGEIWDAQRRAKRP